MFYSWTERYCALNNQYLMYWMDGVKAAERESPKHTIPLHRARLSETCPAKAKVPSDKVKRAFTLVEHENEEWPWVFIARSTEQKRDWMKALAKQIHLLREYERVTREVRKSSAASSVVSPGFKTRQGVNVAVNRKSSVNGHSRPGSPYGTPHVGSSYGLSSSPIAPGQEERMRQHRLRSELSEKRHKDSVASRTDDEKDCVIC